MELKNKLIEIQNKDSLTDEEMAAKLGCTREWWNQIKNNPKKDLSPSLKQTAARVFPELLGIFLSENLTPRKVASEA
jgi:DNA-binding XRE family transcriptional regulator